MGLEQSNDIYSPGTLIAGRFRIVRHVATGSMGAVFVAQDRKLGDTEVALKILHTKFLADQVAFKRFSNEVVFARKLTHPNIVRIYDFEESLSGQKLIVMECVHGITLADLIKEINGDVSVQDPPSSALYEVDFKRIFTIYKKLLQGVAFAHNAGILHRDLKPSNVLIDENDEPKIGDFGLATVAGVSSGLTSDGRSLIGTPDYMAPEQVLGQRMTARSDIYSLGIMAFEMVVGRPPFIAEGPLAVAYMQVQAPFPNLDRLPAFIPQPFIHLIKKATSKTPHERFSSVEEMIDLLNQEHHTPGEIRLPSLQTQRFKKLPPGRFGNPQSTFVPAPPSFANRHPIFIGILILTLAMIVGSSTFLTTNYILEIDRPPAQIEEIKTEAPAPVAPIIKKSKLKKTIQKSS